MELHIEKQCEIRAGTWVSKHKQDKRVKLSDILNEEDLKAMVKQTERNIDKKMKN